MENSKTEASRGASNEGPSSAAEHQRHAREAARLKKCRQRERQRLGIIAATIEYDFELVDRLVALGLLAAWDEDNAAAVIQALSDGIEALAEIVILLKPHNRRIIEDIFAAAKRKIVSRGDAPPLGDVLQKTESLKDLNP